jgi:F-type H+-transporting ATPase subunit delta
MRSGGLTERYVKALTGMTLEGLTLERLVDEVAALAELYSQGAVLREVLENPAFSEGERRAAIEQVGQRLKISNVAKNLLHFLTDNKRTGLLPEIARGLGRHLDAQGGILRARVASATPLSSEQVARIGEVLGKVQGKPVHIEPEVDPALLAGLVIEMEGSVYDGSIKHQLASLRDAILKESP